MEFDKVINKRKSTRSFKDKRASFKDAIIAIDSAIKGPFAGNHNNLKFVIVEDTDTIKKISEFANQPWISQVGLLILVCSDDKHLEHMYGERGRVYSRQQVGAAINTILLKLTELGLDSCWVGAYTDELIKNMLGIPGHIQIEAILPVGYEKPIKGKEKKAKKREIGSNMLYWGVWERSRRPVMMKEQPDPDSLRAD